VDWADNYGQRLSGWLKPPQTGNYTFTNECYPGDAIRDACDKNHTALPNDTRSCNPDRARRRWRWWLLGRRH
jgi:hypothetical protein